MRSVSYTHLYVALLWDWYTQSGDREAVGDFFSRLMFNYLFIGNVQNAHLSKDKFLTKFVAEYSPKCEKVVKEGFEMWIFEDYADLNFLQLLLFTCQTKNGELFKFLKARYAGCVERYSSQLEFLGQEYFGITIQKPVNFMQDILGGLLGGK